jgi:hypothetical protein
MIIESSIHGVGKTSHERDHSSAGGLQSSHKLTTSKLQTYWKSLEPLVFLIVNLASLLSQLLFDVFIQVIPETMLLAANQETPRLRLGLTRSFLEW